MFNEIEGDFNDMAIRTSKVGLPAEHDLRKPLTKKLVRSMCWLMDHIDEYKRVKEDQQQGKGKAKVILQEMKDIKSNRYSNNRDHRDFTGQSGSMALQVVNTMFQEPIHQLIREGRLKQFLYHPNGQGGQARPELQRNASSRAPLGTINVILTTPGKTGSHPSRVMSVARPPAEDPKHEPKRAKVEIQLTLSFSDDDKAGTIQPHDDALVVTLKIGGMM
ncbi:uncharacterized protein LOC115960542 [Quercus lobata]|uniref:uncharacterized protein LOC115960542 n=1 Tax=Quercus lobata TaxID=97700 RepID=UPI0012451DC6|nr:uncharacterized protein LOC115960542 [Quercus lobata]